MNFIKNHWRPLAAVILLILIIGLVKFWPRPKPVDHTKIVDNPLILKQVDSFRDKNDKLYSKVEQEMYTQAQVSHLLDSVALAMGVKVKRINGVEKVVFRDSIVYRDTGKLVILNNGDTAYKVEKHDSWNDIVAVAGKNTGYIKAYIWDSLTRIDISKTSLFKPTIHQIYLNHSNPSIKTIEGASFTVKEKQPWLVIGPYLGYDILHNQVGVGLSATIPILTLKR